jgi:hypothetical protein
MSDDSFDPHEMGARFDVPARLGTLPDGRQSLVLGDVTDYAAFNHHQGDNREHFQLDCGLVSVQDVLQQFGVHVNEGDVVTHALQRSECYVDPAAADQSGGTLPSQDASFTSKASMSASVVRADVEGGRARAPPTSVAGTGSCHWGLAAASEPPNRRCSVSTLIADAPPRPYSAASEAGSQTRCWCGFQPTAHPKFLSWHHPGMPRRRPRTRRGAETGTHAPRQGKSSPVPAG